MFHIVLDWIGFLFFSNFSSFNSISFYTTAYNFLKVVLFRLIYTNHTTEPLQHAIHLKSVMYDIELKTLEAIVIQR